MTQPLIFSMRPLWNDWKRVARRLQSAPLVALFLDFDGTLARLQPRPEQVSLQGPVRQTLAALARSPRFRIWIISGRRQADVRERVRIPRIRYLGLHGWEGGSANTVTEETRRCLASFSSLLRESLACIPGLWIEDKEYAFAVHHADVPPAKVPRARAALEQIVTLWAERFRIESGKNIWEVLPRELEDKGEAVKHALAFLPGRAVPVYVGDDQVDEPAFAALRDGITVHVGNSCHSQAQYSLSGVGEVRAFLEKLRIECA